MPVDILKVTSNEPNVSLSDQNPGMMDTLCKSQLVDTRLESSLQEILDLEG